MKLPMFWVLRGVEYMIENGDKVPFKFNFGAPSCVPATTFETAGAIIDETGIETVIKQARNQIFGGNDELPLAFCWKILW